jgi:hypothetical protein
VRHGDIDPKTPETLSARVHACWINPALQPALPSTATVPAAPSPPASR